MNVKPNDLPKAASNSPKVEAGVYPGLISLICDLGIQKDKKYDSRGKSDDACTDEDYEIAHKVWFSFTLPTERYEVENNGNTEVRDQVIGVKYTLSNNEKSNLMKMYKAVVKDNRTFGQMLGMPVTVTVGMTNTGNPKVTGVAGPMRGTTVAEPLREPMLVDEGDWDNVDDLDLPEFLKDMIKARQ